MQTTRLEILRIRYAFVCENRFKSVSSALLFPKHTIDLNGHSAFKYFSTFFHFFHSHSQGICRVSTDIYRVEGGKFYAVKLGVLCALALLLVLRKFDTQRKYCLKLASRREMKKPITEQSVNIENLLPTRLEAFLEEGFLLLKTSLTTSPKAESEGFSFFLLGLR